MVKPSEVDMKGLIFPRLDRAFIDKIALDLLHVDQNLEEIKQNKYRLSHIELDADEIDDEKSKQMNWTAYFFGVCDAIAAKSKDPSTKVGAVIVGLANEIRSTGYNGFPRGVGDYDERLKDRKIKYQWTLHAEMNAILAAARNGVSLENCTLYTHWHPCHECAKAIIQSGIMKVVVSETFMKKRGRTGWEESFKLAKEMFEEAETEFYIIEENK